jgi:hypothetical protein
MHVCNDSAIVIDGVRGHESAPHIGLLEGQGKGKDPQPTGRSKGKFDATAAAVDRRDSARLEGKERVASFSGWKAAA